MASSHPVNILCGLSTHPRRDGRKQSTTRNLLERLCDRDQQVLRFARDPATVPFSTNQVERDLRLVKTQIRISDCHRRDTGARAWLRVRGYISTTRKNRINVLGRINVLDALGDAIIGTPWTPPHPAAT